MRRPVLLVVLALSLATSAQGPKSIREFVREVFIHGVPYESAMQYPSAAQKELMAILEQPADRPAWPNAATTLGMIGDDAAFDPLVRFVRRGEGTIDPVEYDAKVNAILGMGIMLNRKRAEERALLFLRDGLNPSFWAESIKWRSPFAQSDRERNDELVLTTVQALGISGHPEAAKTLASMKQQKFVQLGTASRESAAAVVDEALNANAQVARQGLRSYLAAAR
jgi:hypothetical protein